MSTCVVEVAFLDGSKLKVTARNDDTCRSIQSAAALAIGVGAEYVSALGLYAYDGCLLYTSPSPRDGLLSRMPSSA